MAIIYPMSGHVLRNKLNGVYSFMANTSNPDAWENVDLSEYEEYQREHPTDDPLANEEALARYANEITGGSAETLQEATENLIKHFKEE